MTKWREELTLRYMEVGTDAIIRIYIFFFVNKIQMYVNIKTFNTAVITCVNFVHNRRRLMFKIIFNINEISNTEIILLWTLSNN